MNDITCFADSYSEDGECFFQYGFLVRSKTNKDLTSRAILSGTGLSAHVFAKPEFPSKAGRTSKLLKPITNGGDIKSNVIGLREDL